MKLRIAKLLTAGLIVSIFVACGGNQSILNSGKESAGRANSETTTTPFAKDLESVQTANFSFIYVLRRKDGGKMDSEDKSVIRQQTAQANRRVAADDDRAVIVGSNFQLAPNNMAAIYQRFAVENLSPAATPAANVKP